MSPAAIIAAIESLSDFDFSRLLASPDFWSAIARNGTLLEEADVHDILDELDGRRLTSRALERLRELLEDNEDEPALPATSAARAQL
jgi:hypothetical protein